MSVMVKNLVRVMMAHEYTRTAFKRDEFAKTVSVNGHRRCFKQVFEGAQSVLRKTLGMEMVELPARDRARHMTLAQQRKQAQSLVNPTNTQTATGSSTSTGQKSWMLRSTLPPRLRQVANRSYVSGENNYSATVSMVLIAVVMSDHQSIAESQLESLFDRLGWGLETPAGPLVEVLQKMHRQGYIDRLKMVDSTDGDHNLYLGPRGKLETLQNKDDLVSLCSKIYNDPEMEGKMARVIQDTLEATD